MVKLTLEQIDLRFVFFNKENRMVRKSIIFHGWVQGVGFRYRAVHAAQMYRCTGWVRNEYDGSVAMEIQGREEDIDRVLQSIQKSTYIRITKMDVKTLPLREDERSFNEW